MKDDRIWELVSLKLSGEASLDELSELEHLMQDSPEIVYKADLLQKLWSEKHDNVNQSSIDDAFNRHLQRLSNYFADPALQYDEAESKNISGNGIKSSRGLKLWISVSVAASIIAIALASTFISRTSSHIPAQNIVATKPGSKSKIILPDGTQVWLNADSKITYNEEFGAALREVELSGEAYFDVVKDKEHPFLIHTKSIDIKVLGTAFNVRSYPDEKTAETSLIRGVIEVTLKNNPDKKIILKPNEKLVVKIDLKQMDAAKTNETSSYNDAPIMVLSRLHYLKGDSSAIETSWVKNKLVFDGESLQSVAQKIERWYGVRINIEDDKLKGDLYTSAFEDESLTEVMNALQMTGSFKYTINKKEITIRP